MANMTTLLRPKCMITVFLVISSCFGMMYLWGDTESGVTRLASTAHRDYTRSRPGSLVNDTNIGSNSHFKDTRVEPKPDAGILSNPGHANIEPKPDAGILSNPGHANIEPKPDAGILSNPGHANIEPKPDAGIQSKPRHASMNVESKPDTRIEPNPDVTGPSPQVKSANAQKREKSLGGLVQLLGVGDKLREMGKQNHSEFLGLGELSDEQLGTILINTTLSKKVAIQGNIWDPLPGYKSHCWVEKWINNYPYTNLSVTEIVRGGVVTPVPTLKHPDHLCRCLPYLYIVGVMKSGTTDLFHSISEHQHVFKGRKKEINFWQHANFRRFIPSTPMGAYIRPRFNFYLDNYFEASQDICRTTSSTPGSLTHPGITVDGSILWWGDVSRRLAPRLTDRFSSATILKYMQPHAKLILMLRNPTSRLFSFFSISQFKGKLAPKNTTSAAIFHNRVTRILSLIKDCLATSHANIDNCTTTIAAPFRKDTRPFYECCEEFNNTYCQEKYKRSPDHTQMKLLIRGLRESIYMLYIHDWLAVFPRDQLMVIVSEQYYANRTLVLNQMATYAGLEPLDAEAVKRVVVRPVKNSQQYDQGILPETLNLLEEFYRPYNTELERILNQKLWK